MKPKRIEECGCCEVRTPSTPERIENRPGLAQLSYRVGTYASFRQAMIEAIAKSPELRAWTARESDDYGIALIEMWAYLADILTFYQERIANEAFLRTALHRDTILRLAAMLDYELNPGVAATTHLAFFVEDGAKVNIPVELRVQSVPGQDEKPQKFETVEELTAEARLNKCRAYPTPEADTPVASDRAFATAISNVSHLAPGDNLVIYEESVSKSIHVEEKKVKELRTIGWRHEVEWEPKILNSFTNNASMHKWVRKLRLFGHNAPEKFLTPVAVDNGITWKIATYDYTRASSCAWDLDAAYDDLKENTELLLISVHNKVVKLVTITGIQQVEATIRGTFDNKSQSVVPLVQTTVTRAIVSPAVPELDARYAIIYELAGPGIDLWHQRYGDTITKSVYVSLAELGLKASEVDDFIAIGRQLILKDKAGSVLTATVTNYTVVAHHLKIDFAPVLAPPFKTHRVDLYANIAKATHGETVSEEILGSGDTAQAFQEFTLKRSPTTFVPSTTAPTGAQNTLKVRIGGVLWEGTRSLYGRKADDEIYVTRIDDEAKMTVRFGDGKTGARLPTGQNNVVAKYRRGLGSEGNVAPDSITTLLDRPTGLKSVTNPEEAKGGTDPESPQQARKNAPNTVRTFERAISLRDYEDLARSYTGIAKARAVKVFKNEHEMIRLTIAGEKGQRIEIDSLTYDNFLGFLELHRDINHLLEVVPHSNKYLTLKATVQVDAAYVTENVTSAAKKAALKFFDFDNLQLGQGIHLSDLYAVIQAVDGVTATLIDHLDYKASDSPSSNVHLLIEPDHIAALNEADLEIVSDFNLVERTSVIGMS